MTQDPDHILQWDTRLLNNLATQTWDLPLLLQQRALHEVLFQLAADLDTCQIAAESLAQQFENYKVLDSVYDQLQVESAKALGRLEQMQSLLKKVANIINQERVPTYRTMSAEVFLPSELAFLEAPDKSAARVVLAAGTPVAVLDMERNFWVTKIAGADDHVMLVGKIALDRLSPIVELESATG